MVSSAAKAVRVPAASASALAAPARLSKAARRFIVGCFMDTLPRMDQLSWQRRGARMSGAGPGGTPVPMEGDFRTLSQCSIYVD